MKRVLVFPGSGEKDTSAEQTGSGGSGVDLEELRRSDFPSYVKACTLLVIREEMNPKPDELYSISGGKQLGKLLLKQNKSLMIYV